jgi:hypothetical protein
MIGYHVLRVFANPNARVRVGSTSILKFYSFEKMAKFAPITNIRFAPNVAFKFLFAVNEM